MRTGHGESARVSAGRQQSLSPSRTRLCKPYLRQALFVFGLALLVYPSHGHGIRFAGQLHPTHNDSDAGHHHCLEEHTFTYTHQRADPRRMMLGCMLLGFVCADIVLLYMVHFPNLLVQSYTYKAISCTLSIFLCVHIDAAWSTVLFRLILPPWVLASAFWKSLVGLINVWVLCILQNMFFWYWRQNPIVTFACKQMGAHVIAFSAINTFSRLQEQAGSEDTGFHPALGVPLAGVLGALGLFCGLRIGHTWREETIYEKLQLPRSLKRPERSMLEITFMATDDRGEPFTVTPEDEDHPAFWLAAVRASEEEALALATGVWTTGWSVWAVTGSAPSYHMEYHSFNHEPPHTAYVFGMALICTVFAVMLVTTMKVNRMWEGTFRYFGHKARALRYAQGYMCMSLSWHIFVFVKVFFGYYCQWDMGDDTVLVLDPELADMLTACGISIVYVFGLIALSVASSWGIMDTDAADVLIEALSLLLGVAWEKAFDVADEVVIEAAEFTCNHPITAKWCLAMVFFILIFPAQLLYVVPVARLPAPEPIDEAGGHAAVEKSRIERFKDALARIKGFHHVTTLHPAARRADFNSAIHQELNHGLATGRSTDGSIYGLANVQYLQRQPDPVEDVCWWCKTFIDYVSPSRSNTTHPHGQQDLEMSVRKAPPNG